MKRLAILASGRGSNFQAILDSIKAGKIKAKVAVLFSNNPNAKALERAKKEGISTECIDSKPYKNKRTEYDLKVMEVLHKYEVDYVLLAGYMRILSPTFVNAYKNRILNIHPSLLPAFPGINAQKQAFDYGVKFTGCTVHFVNNVVDGGPIITQTVVPVYENDTVETLTDRILKEEHKLYPEVVRLLIEGRLKVVGREVIILPPKR